VWSQLRSWQSLLGKRDGKVKLLGGNIPMRERPESGATSGPRWYVSKSYYSSCNGDTTLTGTALEDGDR